MGKLQPRQRPMRYKQRAPSPHNCCNCRADSKWAAPQGWGAWGHTALTLTHTHRAYDSNFKSPSALSSPHLSALRPIAVSTLLASEPAPQSQAITLNHMSSHLISSPPAAPGTVRPLLCAREQALPSCPSARGSPPWMPPALSPRPGCLARPSPTTRICPTRLPCCLAVSPLAEHRAQEPESCVFFSVLDPYAYNSACHSNTCASTSAVWVRGRHHIEGNRAGVRAAAPIAHMHTHLHACTCTLVPHAPPGHCDVQQRSHGHRQEGLSLSCPSLPLAGSASPAQEVLRHCWGRDTTHRTRPKGTGDTQVAS